ncbi:MAG: hypothetical protein HOD67_05685 [Euryarchaeota archaeon]|nr:hypothetical protein [Euryarchaeota archaeon]
MSGLILVGSGWHPLLFRAEINALVGTVDVLHPRVVHFQNTPPASSQEYTNLLSRLSRAALLDDVVQFGGFSDISELDILAQNIANWADDNLPAGSFSVRGRYLGSAVEGISRRGLEIEAGGLIYSETNPVDLENPEHEVVFFICGAVDGATHGDSVICDKPILIWGIREKSFSRPNYIGRQPMDRPFFKPVSLEPRLARLMVSLSHRPEIEPDFAIDPFCGTGGIVIEAAVQGISVLVSDLDPVMAHGVKKNLEWAEIPEGTLVEVARCSTRSISEQWGSRKNCIFAFDPPYGRNAWKSDDGLELFLATLTQALLIDPHSSICSMLPAGAESLENDPSQNYIVMGRPWREVTEKIHACGWDVVLNSPVKVHKSLARMVIVCHPSN